MREKGRERENEFVKQRGNAQTDKECPKGHPLEDHYEQCSYPIDGGVRTPSLKTVRQ